jgi:hypothetical protein
MPLNTSGPISLAGPTGGQSIALELGLSPTGQISLNQTNVRTLAGIASGAITMPTNFYGKGGSTNTKKGFLYGQNGTNIVDNVGVIAAAVAVVGSNPGQNAGCSYGGDKGIIGFGVLPAGGGITNITKLISNTGISSGDIAGVGSAGQNICATGYGGDKGLFGNRRGVGTITSTNLVSNTGVVAADNASVLASKYISSAVTFGGDKGIIAFGRTQSSGNFVVSTSNIVSNVGVVASEIANAITPRSAVGACSFGGDKGIFFGGNRGSGNVTQNIANIVSNTGVISSDIATSQARSGANGVGYDGDKGIIAYGSTTTQVALQNLISNTGVIGAATSCVGPIRASAASCGFSYV